MRWDQAHRGIGRAVITKWVPEERAEIVENLRAYLQLLESQRAKLDHPDGSRRELRAARLVDAAFADGVEWGCQGG